MNGSLYDLKNRLFKLEDVSCQDDKFFEQLFSFMQDLNDEIEGGGIKCLHDFLLLDEIYSEFVDFMAELNSGPARCNIDNDMSELDDRIGWAKASLFAEVDIDTMKDIAWHEYAIDTYDRCYHDLLRESQKFKPSRRDGINEDIWAKMLENEENSLESSIDEGEYYDAVYKKALLNMSRENELCLNITSAGCLYFALKSTNYIDAFHQALRLNILLSETFPDTLKPQFEAWLKGEEASEPGLAQGRRKGGKQKENLFPQEKTDEMKKRFLEYLREKNLQPENVKLSTQQKDAINQVVVSWLKDLEQKNILVKNGYSSYSRNAVFRFLTEICGLETDVEEKTYANKLRDWQSK